PAHHAARPVGETVCLPTLLYARGCGGVPALQQCCIPHCVPTKLGLLVVGALAAG
ncbi:hypothetical protein HDU77_008210, partial [Chytriomyces hyalinus]